ncbi:MAG: hypothetical protein AAF918_12765 [Pseudomonadota bacterium]
MALASWFRPRRLPEPPADAGELNIELTDYFELERDLGAAHAAQVQQRLAERLRSELGPYDTLLDAPAGSFRLAVRDADAVDLHKLARHCVAVIESEPVSSQRALIECRATAQVVNDAIPTLA